MGQHRRFPGSFLLIIAVLAIPSALWAIVSVAENADACASMSKSVMDKVKAKGLKCE
jgi:hypothetical protein